ncbi:DUF1104 domain-containing protein [Helicobacter sp. MIT 03-1614]|jgi:transketolase|uniref:DUF1104 domain-containing protein n=1 Tax=Helicobacter hepaticus (strain ATCC 51449 / 3B1) TaxID=235279 RepID=Q7VFM1_HELHP|nr:MULTISPECIES: DUF1104 domain-containing protein [Helicobacter]AAP78252.1 conserved hypothetical protein [Helicobacter hepaticus ATCC 51449]TLD90723.1 DUF1104 domain-containing protein [Helicobacter sp. MIT 03-1614]
MKNVKVYVLGSVLSALLCSNLNAADFSSRSDAELVKLSGIVKVEEFVDYELEVAKRLKSKTEKEAKEFKSKLKEQYEKATEKLSVKQYREYKKATREAMKKHLEKMSSKERKESGLMACGDFKDSKGKKALCHCKDKK